MRVGDKREFPQRRSRKDRPSSVTSVRTGDSFPRGGSQESCVPRPRPAPLASPARGGGPRQRWWGFPTGRKPRRNPSVSLRSPAPLAGEPRTVCAPSPSYATPLAFPLGGRWHGVAVTDEGRGTSESFRNAEAGSTDPHQSPVCALVPASPEGEAKRLCAPPVLRHAPCLPCKGRGTASAVVGFSDGQEAPEEPLSLAVLDSSPCRGAKDGVRPVAVLRHAPCLPPRGKVARQSRDG